MLAAQPLLGVCPEHVDRPPQILDRDLPLATDLPHGYRPSDDEPFMNERQREYFRRKLVTWKEEILRESRETIQNLQSEPTPNADLADRATVIMTSDHIVATERILAWGPTRLG